MNANRISFFYALSLYAVISVFLMGFQFFAAGALVYFMLDLPHFPYFPGGGLLFRASFCDAVGFGFLAVSSAVLQYFLASLLARDLKGYSGPLGILLISAAFSALFFLRLAARSAFDPYLFAALPLVLSYLLGGCVGIFQDQAENPFRNSRFRLFKVD